MNWCSTPGHTHNEAKVEHDWLRQTSKRNPHTYIRRIPRYLVHELCVCSESGRICSTESHRRQHITSTDRIVSLCDQADFRRLVHIVKTYPSLPEHIKLAIYDTACACGCYELINAIMQSPYRECIPGRLYLVFEYMHWDILDLVLSQGDPSGHVRDSACISVPAISYYMNKYQSLPFSLYQMCIKLSRNCYVRGFDEEMLELAYTLGKIEMKISGESTMPWLVIIPIGYRDDSVLEVLEYILTHSPSGQWRNISIRLVLANIRAGDIRDILEVRLTLEGCRP